MAKSFKARKKARSKDSKRGARIDSTAGVVLPASPASEPHDLAEAVRATGQDSEPPPAPEPVAVAAPVAPVEPPPAPEPIERASAKKVEAAPAAEREVVKPATSLEPVAMKADISGEFKGFFGKTEEEIHLDEVRREAPELLDEVLQVTAPKRVVNRRAHQLVVGVLGFAAAIGIAGAVMRKATPRASAAQTTQTTEIAKQVEVAQPVAQPVTEPRNEPPVAVAPQAAAPEATTAPAPVETAAAVAPPAAPESTAAAPAKTETAAVAPAAEEADPDDALTGAQLLAKARQAIAGNAASKAAALAKKAIAKGAGGSAYYVLGAAYQTMGANGAAKGAYKSCAKAGAAEASECASLAEGL